MRKQKPKSTWDIWVVDLSGTTAQGERTGLCRVAKDIEDEVEAKATVLFLRALVSAHRTDIDYELRPHSKK